MRISVMYNSIHAPQATELICPIDQLGLILKSIADKRIVVQAKAEVTDKEYKQIELLQSLTSNFTVEVPTYTLLREMLSRNYPTYINIPVTDWTLFSTLSSMGVSDIWVDAPLTFQNRKLAEAKQNLNIRMQPNTTNPSIKTECSHYLFPQSLSSFFALDTLDLREPGSEALFLSYQSGISQLPMSTFLPLVSTVDYPISFINEELISRRANCGQRCMEPNNRCHYCKTYYDFLENSIKLERLKNERNN